VAANLARVGVKINLEAETKGTYFPKILRRDTSFYMLGWTASTVDAHNVLNPIMPDAGRQGRGQFNLGAYCNPKVDELTNAVPPRPTEAKRNAMIKEAMKIHQDDVGHLPLHQQALNWGCQEDRQAGAAGRQLHALALCHGWQVRALIHADHRGGAPRSMAPHLAQ
jgi:peptide/nickel transport system substrate-binding protein